MTDRRIHGFLVALTITLAGCAAASGTTPTSPTTPSGPSPAPVLKSASASPAASAAPSAAPTSPSAAPPTPIPTLSATTVKASKAPPGAIRVQMALPGGQPRFLPDAITAKAGSVVFYLENVPGADAPDHSMVIGPADTTFFADGSTPLDQVLAQTPRVAPREALTFTVADLKPGTYVFWCPITHDGGSHAGDGMLGKLTITP